MMSLFYHDLPPKENNTSHHPWEIRIKGQHANKIKHAHNSVNNPKYPKEKRKEPDADRVKFTIIGDRVTKEYIFCTNLVKGLHKYRWKKFAAPIIRGVTTVEWPNVLHDLKIRHGGLAYCLQSSVAVLFNDKFLGGEKELVELIKTRYVYPLYLNYYEESVAQFASFIRSSGRPCAYMHFSLNSEHIGSMIFMLYSDIVPYTCDNFLRLCTMKKGGYSGTPVHRIVKDGWIQCGGYGIKNSCLDCENFIVPHDRRGVLGMANADRHVDCSTQFFVLLQPAPWMAHKYVAFGQLIEGEETLRKIENVPTWYESPSSEIIIYRAGIFNMECQDITINKGTNEYISSHIENLVALGESLYESIIERVFLEIDFKRVKQIELHGEGGEEEANSIHATKRFIRKKEDIEKQLEDIYLEGRSSTLINEAENKEIDVEVCELDPEEYLSQRVTSTTTPSLLVKPEKPFYLAFTDVLYPGEVDSNYDLKKFLKGDYCLESDLQKDATKKKKIAPQDIVSFPSDLLKLFENEAEDSSEKSLDSDEEKEIQKYLKLNVDRVSFAGSIVKGIARGYAKLDIFEDARRSDLITDEELRRFRVASIDYKAREKKVSISTPTSAKAGPKKIKRRQTGFVRPEDLEILNVIKKSASHTIVEDEEESNIIMSRKVRIAPSAITTPTAPHPSRRPTGFIRPSNVDDSDTDVQRQSVLTRLYDDLTYDNEVQGPTLKDYKPLSETQQKNLLLLTFSPNSRIKSEENTRDKYPLNSVTAAKSSYENVLNLQHGKKISKNISSDYVKTIDQIERKFENSIRSVEYARTRPSVTVAEYQTKNLKYKGESRKVSKPELEEIVIKSVADFSKQHAPPGLRLPGDTPLYSLSDDED